MSYGAEGVIVGAISRKRFLIYALLFTMTLINYFDRTVLSIAMPVLRHVFDLSPVASGYLLSAFIWTYAPMQLPAGMILDRWGTRKTAAICLGFWSAATALTAGAFSYGFLFATRLALGFGEPPTFPLGARAVREWAPVKERAYAMSIFASGPAFGTAVCSVIIAWLLGVVGWRMAFVLSGATGGVWVLVWLVFFRNPAHASWLPDAERELILAERRRNDPRHWHSAGRIAQLPDDVGVVPHPGLRELHAVSLPHLAAIVSGAEQTYEHSAFGTGYGLLLSWSRAADRTVRADL